MSYTASGNSNLISDQETTASATAASATNCCSKASAELKLYQAFIFSVPIFFTFILLFLFYLFYLRRRRVDWSSLRMRTNAPLYNTDNDDLSRTEMGLKKDVREMLPIIVFTESFSVKDTQCSVCLGDYQAEDKLQQIPACGHTFHMDCIDNWLATHTTCPLCRQSLIPSVKTSAETPNDPTETNDRSSDAQDGAESPTESSASVHEDSQTAEVYLDPGTRDERILEAGGNREERDSHCTSREIATARTETVGHKGDVV